MKRFLHYFDFAMLGIAVLCMALGVAVLLWPGDAMNVLCYGFGALLVLAGLLQVAGYLIGDSRGFLKKLLLISGILSAAVGVWILLSPDKILRLVGIVLGIVLLYHGIMDVKLGIDIKKCRGRGALPAVLFGLATVGLGVLALVDPFEGDKLLMILMGISFLFDGATDIFTASAVAAAKKQFEALGCAEPVIELDASAAQVVEEAKENKE